jgi:hypothetical protein
MTAMGKQREARQHRKRAAKLILSISLFLDAKLDVLKVPPK